MPTKRTPKNRASKSRITREAVEAFRRMEAASDSEEWWAAHSVLHHALGLPPWEFPAFEYPDTACPYPEGCAAAQEWQKRRDARPQAFELYEALKAASQ